MLEFNEILRRPFEEFMMFIPSLLKALGLLIVIWIVASLVRKAIKKGLTKVGADTYFSKRNVNADGEKTVDNIAKIAYFLVFLFFLPGVFNALALGSIASPITNMFNALFASIPNIVGAAVILVLGYFLAKLLHDLTETFLNTVNVDGMFRKISVSKEETTNTVMLSSVLAKIVFGLAFIPVVTSALEVLNFHTLTDPIVAVLNQVLAMVPNVLVAAVLLVVGYYIAHFVGDLLTSLLQQTGINTMFSMDQTTSRFDLAKIIGAVVQAVILLFITVEALNILKLDVLNAVGITLIAYLPNLISALLIIGLGIVGGFLVEGLINRYAESPFTALIVKYAIIIFAVFMTLEQVKFASTIVTTAFLLVLGGLAVAFALSFGLGGRDFASRQLERFEQKVEEENKKPVPKNNPLDRLKQNKDQDDTQI